MYMKPNNPNIDASHENSGTFNRNPKPSITTIDPFTELKIFRLKDPRILITFHLNINSLRNKFQSSKFIISSILVYL